MNAAAPTWKRIPIFFIPVSRRNSFIWPENPTPSWMDWRLRWCFSRVGFFSIFGVASSPQFTCWLINCIFPWTWPPGSILPPSFSGCWPCSFWPWICNSFLNGKPGGKFWFPHRPRAWCSVWPLPLNWMPPCSGMYAFSSFRSPDWLCLWAAEKEKPDWSPPSGKDYFPLLSAVCWLPLSDPWFLFNSIHKWKEIR